MYHPQNVHSSVFGIMSVYVDVEWVAKEYLKRSKSWAWKKANTMEFLKCSNLECVIEAYAFDNSEPIDLTLDKFMKENQMQYTHQYFKQFAFICQCKYCTG